jgi:hypothetical protein
LKYLKSEIPSTRPEELVKTQEPIEKKNNIIVEQKENELKLRCTPRRTKFQNSYTKGRVEEEEYYSGNSEESGTDGE